MIASIHPGKLSGKVRVPASKSMAHRMLIAAALSDKPTEIEISALNKDIEATMHCLRSLGAKIENTDNIWRVIPIEKAPEKCVLDCSESGSTLRFLIPVAAALGTNATFTGKGRLPERPNAALTDEMKRRGTKVDSDLLPMNVSGGMFPGIWTLPGNVSSQYITGLMFALPLLEGDSEIRLTTKLESASYIKMTIQALSHFGIRINEIPDGWVIPGNQIYTSPGKANVEGDWSAAAFWLAANASGSDITIEGLEPDTTQGDRAAEYMLGTPEINIENTPDLAPALAVAAACRDQVTTITGAARLRIKESDRLAAIRDMICSLGGRADIRGDDLIIHGGKPLTGGHVNGMNDHRIVMAAAIAATFASGPVTISDAQAVAKSYPDFFRDLEMLGGKVHVQ